jgi:hypothetical protein
MLLAEQRRGGDQDRVERGGDRVGVVARAVLGDEDRD